MFEPLSREFLDEPNAFEESILAGWEAEDLLRATLETHRDDPPFVFYEGPPTANGRPGVHHALTRTIKDSVCRFYTMRGRRVLRKAGWDTHGLPVELEVEKQLEINGKPEIEKYGIAGFNEACRNSVFSYKEDWEKLSKRIGFLLDYDQPYVTFHKDYIESVWFLLSRFAANDLLYRGYKVLPWCGRCGTGLSSHEVGQGYKDIDDPSVWVGFPLLDAPAPAQDAILVAWTTTPWTLPSNMGACVHPEFEYAIVESQGRRFILLESKADEVFGEGEWQAVGTIRGRELEGLRYLPLFEAEGLQEIRSGDKRHVVVMDEFVTAEEGTGVVHLAPYGADDFRLAEREGISVQLSVGSDARLLTEIAGVASGTFFKEADKPLMADLKQRERLVKRAQYRHSYPHCWRCDTPLLYFPAPAWFLRTTRYKDEMVARNKAITWAPPEIGAGRFGEWLENNIDWTLSRDRYWGTPLPVWVNEDDPEDWLCVESFEHLARLAGGLPDDFDPHRPIVDEIRFETPTPGKSGRMRRVPQVIDCWFDSGAMPFAQYHWPFENQELVQEQFPADFICEGLDQTRGWFYTLHAIATFLTTVDESLWEQRPELPRLKPGGAYESCMVTGLLLDKQGQKMSKRIGNLVNPWEAVAKHGIDSIRWNMLGGGAVHLSKRYNDDGIAEGRRRVLGTLCSSYDFFALYAKTEGWTLETPRPPRSERPALDRWILARTAQAAADCIEAWQGLEPSMALKAVERLIVDELSNWYIRRSRRRFWSDEDPADQRAAFATLYEVLHALARLIAPAAPFLADALWRRLTNDTASVHLQAFPDARGAKEAVLAGADEEEALVAAMAPILSAASLGRSVRERVSIRVRQPLQRLLIHVTGEERLATSPRDYEEVLKEELNVKQVQWIEGVPDFLQVRAKANFRRLGKRAGKDMKALAACIGELDRATLFALQGGEKTTVQVEGRDYELDGEDVQIETVSVEGLEAATDGRVTIGLETELNEALMLEGLAREILNRIQTQRKESGLEVSDRIRLRVSGSDRVQAAMHAHGSWIADEVLSPEGWEWVEALPDEAQVFRQWDLPGEECLQLSVERLRPSMA